MIYRLYLTEIKGDIKIAGPKILATSIAIAQDILEQDIEQGLTPPNTEIVGEHIEDIHDNVWGSL